MIEKKRKEKQIKVLLQLVGGQLNETMNTQKSKRASNVKKNVSSISTDLTPYQHGTKHDL